jgi:hypothetical protein
MEVKIDHEKIMNKFVMIYSGDDQGDARRRDEVG